MRLMKLAASFGSALFVLASSACSSGGDESSGPAGDCRQTPNACLAGFTCATSDGKWGCVPSGAGGAGGSGGGGAGDAGSSIDAGGDSSDGQTPSGLPAIVVELGYKLIGQPKLHPTTDGGLVLLFESKAQEPTLVKFDSAWNVVYARRIVGIPRVLGNHVEDIVARADGSISLGLDGEFFVPSENGKRTRSVALQISGAPAVEWARVFRELTDEGSVSSPLLPFGEMSNGTFLFGAVLPQAFVSFSPGGGVSGAWAWDTDYFASKTRTSDGGFAGVTRFFTQSGTRHFVQRLGPDGKRTMARVYQRDVPGENPVASASAAVVARGAGLVLVGATSSDSVVQDGLVVAMDATGTVEWAKAFGDSGKEIVSSVTPQGDGFLMLATHTPASGLNAMAYLLRVTADGVPLWWSSVPNAAALYGLHTLQDGRVVMLHASPQKIGLFEIGNDGTSPCVVPWTGLLMSSATVTTVGSEDKPVLSTTHTYVDVTAQSGMPPLSVEQAAIETHAGCL